MKHYLGKTLLLVTTAMGLFACQPEKTQETKSKSNGTTTQAKAHKIMLGSHGSDVDIWRFIADSEAAKAANLAIEVKVIDDGVSLNMATIDGDVDVNAFQSWGFFADFNQSHNNALQAIATTYFEPMGVYSNRFKTLADIPQGATVAIPNDAANHARALRLLQMTKLITLKPDFNQAKGSVSDIVSNPKNLQFKQVKYAHGPRALPDVDLAVIGNTAAKEGGLNVLKDALAREQNDDSVKNNVNILVTTKAKANDPALQKLSALYHTDAVKAYVQQHFQGTKIAVNRPISELSNQ